MQIDFSAHVSSGFDLLDTDIERLKMLSTASGTYLISATGVNGGLLAWRVDGASLPFVLDSYYFTGSMRSMETLDLAWADFVGQRRLIFGVSQSGDLLSCNTSGPGDLGKGVTVALDDSHSPWLQSGLLGAGLQGGTKMIFVADAISGALTGYTIAPTTGTAVFASSTASPSGNASAGKVLLEIVAQPTGDVLLRADLGSQGVTSYGVNADGSLRLIGRLGAAEGLGINTPSVMKVITLWGESFILLGAAESGSLSVMKLGIGGALIATDHLLDTLDTRFDKIAALEAVTVGDRAFIIAGGGDDGLTLFSLLPDGQLIYLQTLSHQTGYGLENVQSIAAAVVEGRIDVYVASATVPGLSKFSIDLAPLGSTLNGAATGSTLTVGTALDDMLISNSTGNDTLQGGAGNDILVSGLGTTRMFGGTGNDLFVIRPSSNRHYVMDFQAGDRIDLGAWPMLHSTAQLIATPTASGILLRYLDNEIEIVSRDGKALALKDLWSNLEFTLPDRVLVMNVLTGLQLLGGTGPDLLQGEAGNDTLQGDGGADRLFGRGGNDSLLGGDAADTLVGDTGADTLLGEVGDDRIEGGDGADSVIAGDGADSIWGSLANDTIYGNAGLDFVAGEAGADLLYGGADADLLLGGSENDTLVGEAGNDTLYGETGNDRIEGGDGADSVSAGDGADSIWGSLANDTIYGNAGADFVAGEAGADLLYGGAEADLLLGGSENDTLVGDVGNDTLYGETGNDRIEGGDGADSVSAGDGADSIWGSLANDTIWGNAGLDFVAGEAGADLLYGGADADLLLGGSENDTLVGDVGNDTLYGETGNDRIEGGDGADSVSAGDGTDSIWGSLANDTIWGNAGLDFVAGEAGADLLYGGADADLLLGGSENDTLVGEAGNDTLYGEAGADSFIFTSSAGADYLADFSGAAGDRITLSQIAGVGSYAQVQAVASTVGGDCLLSFGAGNSLTLHGLSAAGLSADWFLFT